MPDTLKRQYEQHRLDVENKAIEDEVLMSSLGLPGDVSLWDATLEGLHAADVVLGGPAVRGMMDAPGGPVSVEGLAEGTEDVEGGEGSIRNALRDLGMTMVPEGGLDFGSIGSAEDPFEEYGIHVDKEMAGKAVPFLFEMGMYGGVAGGLSHVYSIAGREGVAAIQKVASKMESLAPEVVVAAREALASEAGMADLGAGRQGPPGPITGTTETAADRARRAAIATGEPVEPIIPAALPPEHRAAAEAARTEYQEIAAIYRKKLEGMSSEEVAALKPGTILDKADYKRLNKFVKKQSDKTRRAARKYVEDPTAENLAAFEANMVMVQESVENQMLMRLAEGETHLPEYAVLFKEHPGVSLPADVRGNSARAAEMVSGMNNKQISQFAEQLEGIFRQRGAWQKTGDAFTEAFLNVIYLSHPKTHVANILGNTVAATTTPIDRFIAGWVSEATGTQAVAKGEFAQMMYAWVESFGEATSVGAKTFFSTPKQYRQFMRKHASKLDYAHLNTMTAESFALDQSWHLAALDWVASYTVNLPSRGLFAADEFFKTILRRMETRALAYREAIQTGLVGEEISAHVTSQVLNPSPAIAKGVEKFALTNTFQTELGPHAKGIYNAIRDWDMPFIDTISHIMVPFFKTPVNLFHWANKRTPMGLFYKEMRSKVAQGGATRDLAIAQMITGSSLIALVGTLTYNDKITGAGPKNPVLRQAWKVQGFEPNSIKVAGEWRKYDRLDPVAKLIGTTADVFWAIKTAPKKGEEWYEEMIGSLIPAYTRNFTEGTWMPGISDMLDIATSDDPNRWEGFLKRQSGRLAPGAMRLVEQIQDPQKRETGKYSEGALDYVLMRLQKDTPWWSEDLPPVRNILGEVMYAPGGVWHEAMNPFYSMKPGYENNPLWKELDENRTPVFMPPKVKRVGKEDVELTASQYEDWLLYMNVAEIDNMNMLDTLYTLISSPMYGKQTGGPDGGKSHLIKGVINDFKEKGFSYLWQADDDLFKRMNDAQQIKIELLYGEDQAKQFQENVEELRDRLFRGTR